MITPTILPDAALPSVDEEACIASARRHEPPRKVRRRGHKDGMTRVMNIYRRKVTKDLCVWQS